MLERFQLMVFTFQLYLEHSGNLAEMMSINLKHGYLFCCIEWNLKTFYDN